MEAEEIEKESLCDGFKGANPQRVSTEIIIEIKQLSSGRMAPHRKCMVFPLKDSFTIENGLLFVKIFLYFYVILPCNQKTCQVNIFI